MSATQIQIEFKTESQINIEKFNRQNRAVFNHLMDGRKLHRYDALLLYGIGDLHSRIPEVEQVLKDIGITIKREMIRVKNPGGIETRANEYWLLQTDIDRINNYRKQKQAA